MCLPITLEIEIRKCCRHDNPKAFCYSTLTINLPKDILDPTRTLLSIHASNLFDHESVKSCQNLICRCPYCIIALTFILLMLNLCLMCSSMAAI